MKEEISNLIRIFHERQVVEKIAESKGALAVYEEQKSVLNEELETFKAKAKEAIQSQDHVVCQYKISPKDALQICFICMMTGIDDMKMLENWEKLPIALRKIKGKSARLAENIAHFLGCDEEEDDEGEMFSKYEVEKLLKKFFR